MDTRSMTNAQLADFISAALRELMFRAGPGFAEAWEAAYGDVAVSIILDMQSKLGISII